jgi:hypothetical protein
MTSEVRLWDDNPTLTDLLGFDSVVDAVITALRSPYLDPVTIALQSPWGGGKSSALRQIERRFEGDETVVVLPIDPWEYDDSDDVRGRMITQILTDLQDKAPDDSLTKQFGDLVTRIAWTRVASTIATSALTMQMDADKLVDAFTPKPKEQARDMAGFHAQFEQLMNSLTTVKKVVVLVDDLDRCRPSAVVAILEAIKVFLSVPKMAFVLAAEEEMVRWSISQDIHAGERSAFADRYLEKIVQLPVALPRLTRDVAETYIVLLLSQRRVDKAPFDGLVKHVAERRKALQFPLIGGDYAEGAHKPHPDDIKLAVLFAKGLDADRWSSPRAIKRFLNAWGVRDSIAQTRGISIDADVSLKFYILEERFASDFEVLRTTAEADRVALVEQWEAWANDKDDLDKKDKKVHKPDAVSDLSKDWAATDPSISGKMVEFDRYLSLAATFTSFSSGSGLSDIELKLLSKLGDESDIIRVSAVGEVVAADPSSRHTITDKLIARLGFADHPGQAIMSLCEITKADPTLLAVFLTAIERYGFVRLEVGDVVEIGEVPGTEALLREIAETDGVDSAAAVAASESADRGKI